MVVLASFAVLREEEVNQVIFLLLFAALLPPPPLSFPLSAAVAFRRIEVWKRGDSPSS